MPLGTLDRSPPPFFRQGPSALTKLALCSALALWAILGRPVILLVALIAEALPGVGVLPLWTAVVIAIAVTGRIPGRALR